MYPLSSRRDDRNDGHHPLLSSLCDSLFHRTMSSFPSFSASAHMRHRWSQTRNPSQTTPSSTTPQQQGQRRVTLPAVRNALVVVSVVAVFLLMDLWKYFPPTRGGEPQPNQEPQPPPQALVQSNHNVPATKNQQQEQRGTIIQPSTNSSFSSSTGNESTPWFHRTLTMVVAVFSFDFGHSILPMNVPLFVIAPNIYSCSSSCCFVSSNAGVCCYNATRKRVSMR